MLGNSICSFLKIIKNTFIVCEINLYSGNEILNKKFEKELKIDIKKITGRLTSQSCQVPA